MLLKVTLPPLKLPNPAKARLTGSTHLKRKVKGFVPVQKLRVWSMSYCIPAASVHANIGIKETDTNGIWK